MSFLLVIVNIAFDIGVSLVNALVAGILCECRHKSYRNLLHDDRTNLAFADRAFSHAAPAVWNSLPPDIVSDLSCLATFKRLVKTELYNRAYLR